MKNKKVFSIANIIACVVIIAVTLMVFIKANTISKDNEKPRRGITTPDFK